MRGLCKELIDGMGDPILVHFLTHDTSYPENSRLYSILADKIYFSYPTKKGKKKLKY